MTSPFCVQCVAAALSGHYRTCVTHRVSVCVNLSLMVLDVNSANLGSTPTLTARVGVPPETVHTHNVKLFSELLLILFFCECSECCFHKNGSTEISLFRCILVVFVSSVDVSVEISSQLRLFSVCSCDPHTSLDVTCTTSGQCRCRPEYSGPSCDQCAPGYYGYPSCTCKFRGMFCGGVWPIL